MVKEDSGFGFRGFGGTCGLGLVGLLGLGLRA